MTRLIREEVKELFDAMDAGDIQVIAKESADSALAALEKVGWHLGVVGNHESEIRTCLLSVPELHLEDYPGGVAELGPLDIQEDCLRAIDYLKTLIVLLNRLALGDLDVSESKRVVAESTEYLERMRNFPIRSQNERAKSDRE